MAGAGCFSPTPAPIGSSVWTRAAVGRLVPELIRSPQVQEAVEATLRLSGSAAHQGELVLPSRETPQRTHSRFLAVHGTPLPGPPSSGAVLVFHDVTELRRLERMRQDFVANASHELKTPLASIKAYTETLARLGAARRNRSTSGS